MRKSVFCFFCYFVSGVVSHLPFGNLGIKSGRSFVRFREEVCMATLVLSYMYILCYDLIICHIFRITFSCFLCVFFSSLLVQFYVETEM